MRSDGPGDPLSETGLPARSERRYTGIRSPGLLSFILIEHPVNAMFMVIGMMTGATIGFWYFDLPEAIERSPLYRIGLLWTAGCMVLGGIAGFAAGTPFAVFGTVVSLLRELVRRRKGREDSLASGEDRLPPEVPLVTRQYLPASERADESEGELS